MKTYWNSKDFFSFINKTSFFLSYIYINYLHDTHLDINGSKSNRIELVPSTSQAIKGPPDKDGGR